MFGSAGDFREIFPWYSVLRRLGGQNPGFASRVCGAAAVARAEQNELPSSFLGVSKHWRVLFWGPCMRDPEILGPC